MDQTLTSAALAELALDEMKSHRGGTDPLTALIRLLRPGVTEPMEPILPE